MENIKAHINCIGTCIIRDIVGMHDNNAGYEVENFVQSLNPISLVRKSPLIKKYKSEDVFSDKSNFYKKCINLDLNKQVLNFYREGRRQHINSFWLHEIPSI